ncbi:type II toxin-antitoxin system Phd/YefM family antitoxin [Streptoalloteichus hindustanus]|uniref:Antitoxin n=1 Tax=Streptoalloteichus hindustanus TaxID=2017 RepID=A0A1M5H111_STRHI|nr:type II toxin-antitoxin system prevent-host-death family antitoxin [Streptoalloteichus hindustanus]SHG09654.1 prevent-host-death family protein [Streptoalloteichus hindustanus]
MELRTVETIGVRELRQNASAYLRRVAAGESFTVTDRGHPVALLRPVGPESSLREQLIANGELIPGRGGRFPEPLPPLPGVSASEELQRLRDEERW